MVIGRMSAEAQTNEWVEKTITTMSVEEKVGQLFFADLIAVFSNRESENFRLAERFVRDYHVGGFIVAGGTVSDIALVTNALQKDSKVPLFISGDLEGGLWFHHPYRWMRGRAPELPRFVGGGGTVLPSFMAIGATGNPHFAYEFGRITALEARAVGIRWSNTPVADVNNNPKNPIINTRSFGEDPEEVSAMVAAYVRGAQGERMVATLKHFPGHGDTEEDTHMKLPSLPFDRVRLDSVELVPFRAGIAAGAKAVMTAHIAMPGIDPERRPSTLSPVVITDLLRHGLGFDGIVITDGMTMQGVTDHYTADEAAIRALEAGADVILVPDDFNRAYKGVVDAVKSGRLSIERMNASVRRVLAAKAWAGLDREPLVNIDSIRSIVASPKSVQIADSMFAAALTLLRNRGDVIPLRNNANVRIITVTDDPTLSVGEALQDELKGQTKSVTLSHLWNESSPVTTTRILGEVRNADVVVMGIYLSVGSWKGQLGFSQELKSFFAKLQKLGKPVITIAFGDPYVLGEVPATDAILAVYTGVRKAEEAVARGLTGAVGITGRLPVTIPGAFHRGEGIQQPPVVR